MFLHTKLEKSASYGIPIKFSNVFGHFPAKKLNYLELINIVISVYYDSENAL